MSCTADDSREVLPRFPLDLLEADAAPSAPGRRRRRHLELVAEASESNVLAAAATHDLFDAMDDERSAALTHVYVPISFDPPRDLESQRRFDEFWLAKPAPAPESPAVFVPLFSRVPLFRRRMVLAAVLSAAVIATVALWIGIFVLLASTMGGEAQESATEDVETAGSNGATR